MLAFQWQASLKLNLLFIYSIHQFWKDIIARVWEKKKKNWKGNSQSKKKKLQLCFNLVWEKNQPDFFFFFTISPKWFGQNEEQQQQQTFDFVARLFRHPGRIDCKLLLVWVCYVLTLRPLEGHLVNPGLQKPFRCSNDGLFHLSRLALRWPTAGSSSLSVVNNSLRSNA